MPYRYVILGSELELKKVQTPVSKHLGILPKIRGRGNSAQVWVKTASSETIIVYLVYWTCLQHGGSVKYLFFVCLVISLPSSKIFILDFLTFYNG